MKKISLESKTYGFLLYIGFALILYNIFLFLNQDSLFMSRFKTDDITSLDFVSFGFLLCSAIIAGIVAHKLNRSIIFWVIITFFFAPISLIILGTKKIYLKPELKKIYNKYESEYFLSKIKLKKDLERNKLTKKLYDKNLSELLNNLDNEMNIELQNKEIEIVSDFDKKVIHKIEKSGNGQVVKVKDVCPACNTKLSEIDFECPECGLNLK